MKIGIYDKWLETMGGGEKVATVMAEVLSKHNHEVDLIHTSETEKEVLEQKMGVDLSKVKMSLWEGKSESVLTRLTRKYDLFINVSYLDHMASTARRSLYYVHFPTPVRTSFMGLIKYSITLPFLRKFLIIPKISRGLKNIDEIVVRGGKWLGPTNTLVLENAPEVFTLKLRIYVERLVLSSLDNVKLYSNNAKIQITDRYIDHENNVLTYSVRVTLKEKQALVLKIDIAESARENAYGLVSLTVNNARHFLWNIIKRYLPNYEMALYGSSSYKVFRGIETYDALLSNSMFTQKWVKQYWNKQSQILYPPVDVEMFRPRKKKRRILHVGRFFLGGHSKRQDILIEAFKRMCDKKMFQGSWELHLAGGVASGIMHQEYLKSLQKAAEGYPIYFHLFASFSELERLYGEASIYWHATGYGIDERSEPVKMEHFGITPVEAMSAGCVPMLYKGGGVTESVGNHNELTWRTISQLINSTQTLIFSPARMQKLSVQMRKDAQRFSKKNFERQLLEIVDRVSK